MFQTRIKASVIGTSPSGPITPAVSITNKSVPTWHISFLSKAKSKCPLYNSSSSTMTINIIKEWGF
jgi:hypothetical protein